MEKYSSLKTGAGVPLMPSNWTFCPSIKGENTSIVAKEPISARFNRFKKKLSRISRF